MVLRTSWSKYKGTVSKVTSEVPRPFVVVVVKDIVTGTKRLSSESLFPSDGRLSLVNRSVSIDGLDWIVTSGSIGDELNASTSVGFFRLHGFASTCVCPVCFLWPSTPVPNGNCPSNSFVLIDVCLSVEAIEVDSDVVVGSIRPTRLCLYVTSPCMDCGKFHSKYSIVCVGTRPKRIQVKALLHMFVTVSCCFTLPLFAIAR